MCLDVSCLQLEKSKSLFSDLNTQRSELTQRYMDLAQKLEDKTRAEEENQQKFEQLEQQITRTQQVRLGELKYHSVPWRSSSPPTYDDRQDFLGSTGNGGGGGGEGG